MVFVKVVRMLLFFFFSIMMMLTVMTNDVSGFASPPNVSFYFTFIDGLFFLLSYSLTFSFTLHHFSVCESAIVQGGLDTSPGGLREQCVLDMVKRDLPG